MCISFMLAGALTLGGSAVVTAPAYAEDDPVATGSSIEVPAEDVPPNPTHMWTMLAGALTLGGSAVVTAPAYAEDDPVATGSSIEVPAEDVPPNPTHMWTTPDTSTAPGSGDQSTAGSAAPRVRSAARAQWGWGVTGPNNGYKTFRQSDGTLMNPVLKVIDVSEHQGSIDWTRVKNSGIDGVILRIAPRVRSAARAQWGWGVTGPNNGYKTFRQSDGTLMNPVLKVIDVSEHQGSIDWTRVKNSGIDGVILRIGYGYGFEDARFSQYLAKVRALKIPFGIYHYSYAYDTDFAREEGKWTVELLRKYRVTDNAYPIFYDLEQGDWGGHKMPAAPAQYESIARTYFHELSSAGYTNTYIYSYLNNMSTRLNSTWLHARTGWIAQYNTALDYEFPQYNGTRAWQYTSQAAVPGMSTRLNSTWLHARTGWIAQYNTALDYEFPQYNGTRAWQYTSQAAVPGIEGYVDMNVFDRQMYRDVTFRTPHYDDVMWLSQYGISTGWSDGTFRGADTVKRQDMAAFLRDVTFRTPHYDDVMWLSQYGISTGWSDGTFRGADTVKRQDMAAFLRREAVRRGISGAATWKPSAADWKRFNDVTSSTPHAEDILWLASAGIATG